LSPPSSSSTEAGSAAAATDRARAPSVELVREYRFEAAHMLPRVPDGHRCKRLHGHSYKVEIAVAGPVDEATGWLIDFYDMDAAVTPLIEALDHRTLNDLPELDNPTCERLCAWLWTRLGPRLPQLSAVTVWETVDARCSYRGCAVDRGSRAG
jgi:6-pyruvoyltetrahydropterin/6-carboxytetrahydropterin synthase